MNNTSFLFVTQMQYESTVLDTEIYLETEHINENYEAYLLEKLRDQFEEQPMNNLELLIELME